MQQMILIIRNFSRLHIITDELDALYAEKKELEAKELLEAIAKSSKTRTEILAFLESA